MWLGLSNKCQVLANDNSILYSVLSFVEFEVSINKLITISIANHGVADMIRVRQSKWVKSRKPHAG